MDYITLTELLGSKVRRIQSGSELLFVWELYKYSKELLDRVLTIEDAQVLKAVRDGEHFAYVYNNSELNLNYTPSENEILADYSETDRKYFKGDLSGIVFEKQTEEDWTYCYHTDKSANIVLYGYNRSAGYVSLYAYMVVKAYKEGKKVPKLILKNLSPKQEEQEYVDILILMNYGNQWLKDKVEIQFSKEVVVQPEWEAFIMYQRQLGNMLEETPLLKKIKYMTKHFVVGDVVLYYQTDKSIKSKSIRKLTNCFPAVITEINKNEFKLNYYPMIETFLTHKTRLEEVEQNSGIEGFKYTSYDYNNFPVCSVTLDYISTGIDILTYTEDSFILKLMKGTDTFPQYIKNSNGMTHIYDLDTINTIYAVFEDRKVEYLKERFLQLHFKREIPVYDEIRTKKTKTKKTKTKTKKTKTKGKTSPVSKGEKRNVRGK